jgi:hypothetical protein
MSAHIPSSTSQTTDPLTSALAQLDIIPSFLHLPTHEASFSNASNSFFSFHVDSAMTAHMELDHILFTHYSPYNPPLMVKLANDDVVFAPG